MRPPANNQNPTGKIDAIPPSQGYVLRHGQLGGDTQPGDILVDSDMRRAYLIHSDGSRRRLGKEHTTKIVGDIRRRLADGEGTDG